MRPVIGITTYAQELIAEKLVPESRDLLALRVEAVSPEVEAIPVSHHGQGQPAETSDEGDTSSRRVRIPGYVLVRMDLSDESWGAVRHTPGVTGFVGHTHQPVPLSLDEVFSMLMGDQVEPRREFIEKNALAVANLDV